MGNIEDKQVVQVSDVPEIDFSKLLGFRHLSTTETESEALARAMSDAHNKIGPEVPPA